MKRFLTLTVALFMTVSLLTGCSKKQSEEPKNNIPAETNTSTETSSYENNDLLVDADWLNDNLDKGIVIIDARDDKSYSKEHIKGAIFTAWQPFTDMEAKKMGDKGWGTLLEPAKLSQVISKLGIDADKTVVLYSAAPEGWGEDGRIAWTLKSAGIKNVKLLNGGYKAWKDKGYPTDTEVPTITPSNFTTSSLDDSLNVTTDYIKNNIDKLKIIDVREADEYNGATKYGEKRGGHLPNAINITWTELLNSDGTVKSQKDLEALLTSKGINKDDEIVSYCTKGIRSAHMCLILNMAGYTKAKNYDASFYEWAGDSQLEVVK